MTYINIAYHKIENAIVDRVNEDYFRDTFTANTVATQNEYAIQTATSTVESVKKIQRVEVKRQSTDDYYTLLDNSKSLQDYEMSDDILQAQNSVGL